MTIEQNVNNDANYLHMDIYEFEKDLIRGRYNWIVYSSKKKNKNARQQFDSKHCV